MRCWICWSVVLGILPLSPVAGQEVRRGPDASMELLLGQHFSGSVAGPSFFPMMVLRGGYRVSDDFNTRLGVSAAGTRVSGSSRESFNSAGFMVGDLALGLIYSPALGDDFTLELGGELGLWMSALWGDDLLDDTVSGRNYLEGLSLSYAALAGGQFRFWNQWALIGELRFNVAMVEWGGQAYNTGGLTVLVGLAYLFVTSGI